MNGSVFVNKPHHMVEIDSNIGLDVSILTDLVADKVTSSG